MYEVGPINKKHPLPGLITWQQKSLTGTPHGAQRADRLAKQREINAKSGTPPFLAPITASNLQFSGKLESKIGSITDA